MYKCVICDLWFCFFIDLVDFICIYIIKWVVLYVYIGKIVFFFKNIKIYVFFKVFLFRIRFCKINVSIKVFYSIILIVKKVILVLLCLLKEYGDV